MKGCGWIDFLLQVCVGDALGGVCRNPPLEELGQRYPPQELYFERALVNNIHPMTP